MKRIALISLMILAVTVMLSAQAIQLKPGVQVKMADGTPMQVGKIGHAAP